MNAGRIFRIARNRVAIVVSALGALFIAGIAGQAVAVSGAPSVQQVAKKDCDKKDHDGDKDRGCSGYHGKGHHGDGDDDSQGSNDN